MVRFGKSSSETEYIYQYLYLPKNSPDIIKVPSMSFVMIGDEGDPNGESDSKFMKLLQEKGF